MWTRLFLIAQGYNIDKNLVYRDNKSELFLEENGQLSISQRTKHINVRYYFMKDRIANNELEVVYCPTEDMIGDYFTKPLQGKQFIQFRNMILEITDNS